LTEDELRYLFGTVYLVVSALAVWIVRDSRNRSVENGVVWMLLVLPLNMLALITYLLARPQELAGSVPALPQRSAPVRRGVPPMPKGDRGRSRGIRT
jgi:hypothetical protein